MTVYDRDGTAYEVTPNEAEQLLATGAYFENARQIGDSKMPTSCSPLMTIYDIKTGKSLKRRPVDARELVHSGYYSFEKPGEINKQELNPQPPQGEARRPAPLPVLTDSASKEEIIACLTQYGVQFRANMGKTDLLNLWQNYVLEQGQN